MDLDEIPTLSERLPQIAFRLVIVESPFAGATPAETERNVAYARAALADCLSRDEAPFASHLLYTQPGVLDDGKQEERLKGIAAGLAWGRLAAATVVYSDFGISRGMRQGIYDAQLRGRPVEHRQLDGWIGQACSPPDR